MTVRNNVSSSSGDFNTLVAGSVVAGTAIFMGNIAPKLKSLSAKVAVTAATSTITLAAKWQVSNDNSTWIDVSNGTQNAAAVVLATGTTTIVTKVIAAPEAAYGWMWARVAVVTGVATGGATDLYAIGYNYRQMSSGDRG